MPPKLVLCTASQPATAPTRVTDTPGVPTHTGTQSARLWLAFAPSPGTQAALGLRVTDTPGVPTHSGTQSARPWLGFAPLPWHQDRIRAPLPASMLVSCHEFKVHSFDTDAFGLLSVPGLLGYLLEASGRSADRLGFGIAKLQRESNLTWVIARIKLELTDTLRLLDDIEIRTWPSGLMRSAAMREFQIAKSGHEVGRATSSWFVLDMESRFPVRPHEFLPPSLHAQTEHLVPLSNSIPALSEPPDTERNFAVRFADIDLNRHVTAMSYIAWAMEAVPEALWANQRLASLDVQFMQECFLGQEITTGSRELSPDTRLHRISLTGEGKELARLVTTWVPREDA